MIYSLICRAGNIQLNITGDKQLNIQGDIQLDKQSDIQLNIHGEIQLDIQGDIQIFTIYEHRKGYLFFTTSLPISAQASKPISS